MDLCQICVWDMFSMQFVFEIFNLEFQFSEKNCLSIWKMIAYTSVNFILAFFVYFFSFLPSFR